MPYPASTYFNPSDRYKETWSLVPQVRTLKVSSQETKSLYSSLSSAIPIFYVLMFTAIAFDVYLGFAILAKQGVNIALIIGSVVLDLFFAITPFLVECFINRNWNHVKVNNEIFQRKLECQTKKRTETEKQFQDRRENIKSGVLKEYESAQLRGNILRFILILFIFAIAGWKMWTFYKVLPPGVGIFSLVNGKIVIIFSILCAVFHIIGSEKAFAHFMFWLRGGSEFSNYMRTHNGQRPQSTERTIEYEGTYIDATSQNGNTSILNRGGNVYLQFIHIIRDDEIQDLINAQTDDNAKRGVAIKCKENQLIV